MSAAGLRIGAPAGDHDKPSAVNRCTCAAGSSMLHCLDSGRGGDWVGRGSERAHPVAGIRGRDGAGDLNDQSSVTSGGQHIDRRQTFPNLGSASRASWSDASRSVARSSPEDVRSGRSALDEQ
jgi:hypothetical protein